MAKFSFDGIDTISASFEQLTQLSDEEKYSIIRPAADLLIKKYSDKIKSLFHQRTGTLAASITAEQRSDEDGVFSHIFPKGKHPGSSTGKRKGKRGSNGKYSGTNAEVAYILEYGSPRIAASHWMETTNEEVSDEIAAAQQAAWDELLTQKGL